MKLGIISLAALAATASAVPLRIITLTGPVPHLPPSELSHSLQNENREEGEMRIMPHPFQPCGKNRGHSAGGRFTDLLTRLGFVRPTHHHGPEHDSGVYHHHKENENKVVKAWKHHVDEMMGQVVPILEGGDIRILPFTEEDRVNVHAHGNTHMVGQEYGHGHGYGHGREHGKGREGHLRAHGGHHWRHKSSSFGGRLHRAVLNLAPPEAIALAFVLGAGIGSIMHLIFMFFLLSIRRFRSGGGCRVRREERRERRRMRKEARRAAKLARYEGKVVDEIKMEGEVLPGYGEGEEDRLVEKA